MILRVYFSSRLIIISTEAAAIHDPNTNARPPVVPAAMIGPMNEKLVPCMQSNPVPMKPKRRHCIKVAMPEAMSAIETR